MMGGGGEEEKMIAQVIKSSLAAELDSLLTCCIFCYPKYSYILTTLILLRGGSSKRIRAKAVEEIRAIFQTLVPDVWD